MRRPEFRATESQHSWSYLDLGAAHKARLKLYIDMMDRGGHHDHMDHVIADAPERVSRNIFDLDFPR